MKLLLVDLDGTIRHTKSGKTLINTPDDQQLIDGALASLTSYMDNGFTIFGVTNQGGVAAGHKSLNQCVIEQRITIELCLGCLELIFFCPGDGRTMHCVDAQDSRLVKAYQSPASVGLLTGFRKPCAGMLRYAMAATNTEPNATVMVGDRPEDETAAYYAHCIFIDAHLFRNPDTRMQWRSPRDPDTLLAAWSARHAAVASDGPVSGEGLVTPARGRR